MSVTARRCRRFFGYCAALVACAGSARPALGAASTDKKAAALPAPTRIVAVVHAAAEDSRLPASYVAHHVEAAIGSDRRYTLVSLEEALGVPRVLEAARALQVADMRVEEGRKAYLALEFAGASASLNEALALFEQQSPYVSRVDKVVEALLLSGAVRFLSNDVKGAAEKFRAALALRPEVEPDLSVFNPPMARFFEKTAADLKRKPKASLQVESGRDGARAYVDGRLVGMTPVTVRDLVAGQHYVRLADLGCFGWGTVVHLAANDLTTISGDLETTRELSPIYDKMSKASAKPMALRVSDGLEGLKIALKVDQVMLVEVRLKEGNVDLWARQLEVESHKLVGTGTRFFAPPPPTIGREMEELLAKSFGFVAGAQAVTSAGGNLEEDTSLRDADLFRGEATATMPPTCPGMPCKELKRFALYGSAGGAVLAGIGLLLSYLAGRDHDRYRDPALVQTSAEVRQLRSSGRAKGIAGATLLSVGITALLAGGAVWVLVPDEPAPGSLEDDGGGAGAGDR